uniref:Major sperm protein n=1 Tax=Wuchereria bancrofti TaxID=6293 RepID=A0A1I8EXH1_WUCBA
MTDADDIDELHNHLRLLVFDQKHMTGRGLRFLREQTGLDEFSLAIFICVITSVYLMVGEDAQMLANAILTVTPILLTYVFPAEKPPTPQLLIYWSAFGLLTLLDSNFESESGYYFIKVVLLALLFLHPFDGADRILWHIRLAHSDEVKDESGIIPFTKEELSEMLQESKDRRSLPLGTPQTMKLNGVSSHVLRSDYSSSYDSVPEGKNPMLFNTEFRIQDQEGTSAEGLSINYSPHDLAFEPSKYLVGLIQKPITKEQLGNALNDFKLYKSQKIFNAPYDFDNLTYLIRIRNTSTKYIAYAIKSNAIPRVFATPPCGILPPKQKCDIAVTVKKMDKFVEQLVQNDRLAFDYVFCSPETKQFKFKLLQSEMRRRKNIYIKYNP